MNIFHEANKDHYYYKEKNVAKGPSYRVKMLNVKCGTFIMFGSQWFIVYVYMYADHCKYN